MVVGLAAIVVAVVAAWSFTGVEHTATGSRQETIAIDVDFSKFRQIMVRKNATKAIVEHSGLRLLEDRIVGVELDTSADKRPLLNALRGQTQSELSATRQFVVELKHPELQADQLTLTQSADIQPQAMLIRTASDDPAGNLENYATSLQASPSGAGTEVSLSVDLQVKVRVARIFTSVADRRVQQAADQAVAEQAAAIQEFVSKYAQQLIVLPEFGQ